MARADYDMNAQPAFMVIVARHQYAVYANGKIDGFGEDAVIINRIPILIEVGRQQGTPLTRRVKWFIRNHWLALQSRVA